MIDLTKIRSIKTLKEMVEDLRYFIKEPIIKDIYKEERGADGDEDYEDDRDTAEMLLFKVEARLKELQFPPKLIKKKQKQRPNNPPTTVSVEEASLPVEI